MMLVREAMPYLICVVGITWDTDTQLGGDAFGRTLEEVPFSYFRRIWCVWSEITRLSENKDSKCMPHLNVLVGVAVNGAFILFSFFLNDFCGPRNFFIILHYFCAFGMEYGMPKTDMRVQTLPRKRIFNPKNSNKHKEVLDVKIYGSGSPGSNVFSPIKWIKKRLLKKWKRFFMKKKCFLFKKHLNVFKRFEPRTRSIEPGP